MNGFQKNTSRLVTATAAAMLFTLPTLACGDEDDDAIVVEKIVVAPSGIVARAAVLHADAMTAIWNDDDHLVELLVEDGDITVIVDGKELPQSRIRREDGRVIVLDEDGLELRSLNLSLGGGDVEVIGLDGLNQRLRVMAGPQLNVMIGVHMGEPGEALRTHLRLEAGETTMISGLYEGLPAHKAGLEQYDIIVAVDGRQPAGQQDVRGTLADMEAGDEITFTVIHKGRTREYTVTLEEFDSSRMESSKLLGGGGFIGNFVFPGPGSGSQTFEFKGEGFDWKKYLIDPDSRDMWRFLDGAGLSRRLQRQLQDRLPEDLDDRLERLNDRIDEIKEMIDMFIEQARDIARESE